MKLSRTVMTVVSLSVISLTGCATHTMTMNYQPSETPELAVMVNTTKPTKIVLGEIVDSRDAESNWLGAVRGAHGFASTKIYSDGDTADVLSAAFESALETRGMLGNAGTAAYRIDIDLVEFDSSQRQGNQTRTDIAVTVRDTQSGNAVFERHFRTRYETGQNVSTRLDPAAALGEFANLALNESVDQILADPDLAEILQNESTVQLVSASLSH